MIFIVVLLERRGCVKKVKKGYISIITIVILIFSISTISLALPNWNYRNRRYTYDYWGNVVSSPLAYTGEKIISGSDLNVGKLNSPQDIMVRNNFIYILDTGNNRIIKINKNWKIVKEITGFNHKEKEKQDNFNHPTGIYVTEAGKIYIADKKNGRIVKLTSEAKLESIIRLEGEKVKGIIPADVSFRPHKIAVDPAGRIYVIADNMYEGILTFDSQGDFNGFIGAPEVNPNPVDVFWRSISTQEQRSRQTLFLPIEYNNLNVDNIGMLMAVVSGDAGPETIKRLGPDGSDNLLRNGYHPPQGDMLAAHMGSPSVFIDILPRDHGLYSVLDRTRNSIFTYDESGNLLYILGGEGKTLGRLKNPVAIEEINNKIIVMDNNILTVFKPTKYGKNIHQAIAAYRKGYYDSSQKNWEKVLKDNINYGLAYSGVGRNLYRKNKYRQALKNFKLGNDREGYSKSFRHYRRNLIENNFNKIIIFFIVVLTIIILYKFLRKSSLPLKKNVFKLTAVTKIKNRLDSNKGFLNLIKGLRYSLYVIFHPFDGFWDLKHENKGSIYSAGLILILVGISYTIMWQYTGFLFNTRNLENLNIYFELASILVPFMLWCSVNWSLTTLMEGKGTLKEIFITSSYALTPLILINLPVTILSNYLTLQEGTFYHFFITLAILWSLALLFFGNLVVHDYTLSKTLLTTILTLGGMGFVLFISLLFFNLFEEVVSFAGNLIMEVSLRWGS